VSEFLTAFLTSFGVVFVAELGDKSQLISLAFTAKYRWPIVLTGVAIASFLMHGLAVLVGSALGAVIPGRAVRILGGVAFLVFGLLNLRPEDDEDEDEAAAAAARSGRSAVAAVTTTFVLAEFGDKTQLAALTLAGTYVGWGVWPGAALGMIAANGLAIAAGVLLGKRLPEATLRKVAGGLFLLFGVLLLFEGIRG
jgi:Ca2+/H+ antiporter, TMEM165/GDT1 family